MPILKSVPPPGDLAESNATTSRTNSRDVPAPPNGQNSDVPPDGQNTKDHQHLTIPAVHLDVDEISSAMAARLASSLVSHVLFLKSQIPFPVVQLARMPTSKDNKATKKKVDLMNAIDTLSSHLYTTFRALSTAFAVSVTSGPSGHKSHDQPPSRQAQAHMAIVLGAGVGAPKARVMLVMSGLKVHHAGVAQKQAHSLGATDGLAAKENVQVDEEEGSGSESEDDSSEGESEYYTDEDGESSDECPDTPPESDSSRSASPAPSEANPQPDPFLEEQQVLRTADRLLSRTLASACAESDGGLSSELAPTQTHILLRAPRHFDHPEWTPRQNLTRSLEKTLTVFLNGAIADPEAQAPASKPKYTSGPRTEGVWIGSKSQKLHVEPVDVDPDSPTQEESDMIWWTWNGKIMGFNDW
ncbi:hypothetical protein EUX98_g4632 [Antrodiella citrinella]|uniref:Uncharacterized protein n=1 Tax=Antrodiella citrinella TaxID=2447956 RepID=A0A4S4MVF8_9APHY|nr:hypothetical protein EUX98_g4632 [Antrodiella citrinella]